MPLIAFGYLVEQDCMKQFFPDDLLEDGSMDPIDLVSNVNIWQTLLIPEERVGVPRVKRWYFLLFHLLRPFLIFHLACSTSLTTQA
jgi:hypothetical protein